MKSDLGLFKQINLGDFYLWIRNRINNNNRDSEKLHK